MRDIKFRGWDKDSGLVEILSIDFQNNKVRINHWRYGDSEYFDLDDLEIMQSVGLKDSNGTDIYEGDILRINDYQNMEKIVGQVVWGLTHAGFGNYPAYAIPQFESEVNSFAEIFDSGDYSVEVIGNIYESPEMLD